MGDVRTQPRRVSNLPFARPAVLRLLNLASLVESFGSLCGCRHRSHRLDKVGQLARNIKVCATRRVLRPHLSDSHWRLYLWFLLPPFCFVSRFSACARWPAKRRRPTGATTTSQPVSFNLLSIRSTVLD